MAPVAAAPSIAPYVSLSAGGAVTGEVDYSAASGAAFQAQLGLSIGGDWGVIVQGGAAYQTATAYTADWYRFRGFFGLNLGAGPRHDFGAVDAYLLAGGHLARYDNSYSYFWFPYVEPGASMPLLAIGELFRLDAGVSLPVQLRADCFSAGLKAVVTLAFLPPRESARQEDE